MEKNDAQISGFKKVLKRIFLIPSQLRSQKRKKTVTRLV